jgi:hypothetical protein
MPVDKLSTVPRVLKSNESINEINEKAQDRLHRRRLSDLRKHNFLFGAEKIAKHPHRRVVMTITHDSTPHYK